jgi:pSer/pThr/pTyr-binding forkhead associated (FHA) protein
MIYRPDALAVAAPPPEPEVATLTVAGRRLPVRTDRVVLGRSRDADVQVDDANVSRLHCEVARGGDGAWTVADLGSTNGTELNGRRVDRASLTDGDRITIGGTTIVFGRSGS